MDSHNDGNTDMEKWRREMQNWEYMIVQIILDTGGGYSYIRGFCNVNGKQQPDIKLPFSVVKKKAVYPFEFVEY